MRLVKPMKRFLEDEFYPYFREPKKKKIVTQIKEMRKLWSYYRYIPYHYIKNRLYLRTFDGDILNYVPPKLVERLQDEDNHPAELPIIRDKARFAHHMNAYNLPCIAPYWSVDAEGIFHNAEGQRTSAEQIMRDATAAGLTELFHKDIAGANGDGAGIMMIEERTMPSLRALRNTILQPVVRQHPQVEALFPQALNTIRLDSLLIGNDVIHNAAAFRMGVGDMIVDNWSKGGIVVGVDLETGRLYRTGFRKNKFLAPAYDYHPDTGIFFEGYQLPFWEEVKAVVQRAARTLPGLKTLCWDVAIGADGPVLIEANDHWSVYMIQRAWGGIRDTHLGRQALRRHGLTPRA